MSNEMKKLMEVMSGANPLGFVNEESATSERTVSIENVADRVIVYQLKSNGEMYGSVVDEFSTKGGIANAIVVRMDNDHTYLITTRGSEVSLYLDEMLAQ